MLIFPLLGEGEEKGGEGKIKFGFEFSNVSFCRVERYFPLLPPGNIFRQGLPDKMLRDHDKHRRFFKQTLPWYFRDQVTQTFSRDEKNQGGLKGLNDGNLVPRDFFQVPGNEVGTNADRFASTVVPSSPPPCRFGRDKILD